MIFRFIDNFLRRRRLRPVVIDLPRTLKKNFGASDFYSAGQVDTASRKLKLKPGVMPAAHAIALTPEEFSSAEPGLSTSDYQAVRAEIARLFDLDEWHINCRTLRSSFKTKPDWSHSRPPERHDGGFGGPGGSGGRD